MVTCCGVQLVYMIKIPGYDLWIPVLLYITFKLLSMDQQPQCVWQCVRNANSQTQPPTY